MPPEDADALVARLVAADSQTQADLAWLRVLAKLRPLLTLEKPPCRVRQVLRERFRRRYATTELAPGLFQRLVAVLCFDSRLQPGVAGARSGPGQTFQLLYSSEVADVELHVLPTETGEGFTLLGQALPLASDANVTGCAVQLLTGEVEWGLTSTNELGEFSFESVPSGEYELI
ncbi:MAG TPA: hypothetical protein EYP04_06245, partial [Anaerolineae bacterium]|nr:hypothetical protein [Anaerolineae bacterium]